MPLVSINRNPTPKHVFQFAILGALLGAAFAIGSLARHGTSKTVLVWGSVSCLFLLIGVCFPRLMKAIYVGLVLLTFPIGRIMSYVLLTLVYFGLFMPVALIFRVIGRDSLQRRFEPTASTYWSPKSSPKHLRRYFQQF